MEGGGGGDDDALVAEVAVAARFRGAATAAAVRARLGAAARAGAGARRAGGAAAGGKENAGVGAAGAKALAGAHAECAVAVARAALARAKACPAGGEGQRDAEQLLACAETALDAMTAVWPALTAAPLELESQRYALVRLLAARKLHARALSAGSDLYAKLCSLAAPASKSARAKGGAADGSAVWVGSLPELLAPNNRRATKPAAMATLVLGAALCVATSAAETIDEAPEVSLAALASLARDGEALAEWLLLGAGSDEAAAKKHWSSLYRCMYRAAGRALQLSPGPYADLVGRVGAGAVRSCGRASEEAQVPALAAKLAALASGEHGVATTVLEAALEALVPVGDRAALPLCTIADNYLKVAPERASAYLAGQASAAEKAAPSCSVALTAYAAAAELVDAGSLKREVDCGVLTAGARALSGQADTPASLRALDAVRRSASSLAEQHWSDAIQRKFSPAESKKLPAEGSSALVGMLCSLVNGVVEAIERGRGGDLELYATKLRSSAAAGAVIAARCALAADVAEDEAVAALERICNMPVVKLGVDVASWVAANAYNVGAQLSNAKHRARALPLLRAAATAARSAADGKPDDATLAQSAEQKAAAASACEARAAEETGGLDALVSSAVDAASHGDVVALAAASRRFVRTCRNDFADDARGGEVPQLHVAAASVDGSFSAERPSKACLELLWHEVDAWGASSSRGSDSWRESCDAARRVALNVLAGETCDSTTRTLALLQLAEGGHVTLDDHVDALATEDGFPPELVTAVAALRMAAAHQRGSDDAAAALGEQLAAAALDVDEGVGLASRVATAAVRSCLVAADAAYLRGCPLQQALAIAAAAVVAGEDDQARAAVSAVRASQASSLFIAKDDGDLSDSVARVLEAGREAMERVLKLADPSRSPLGFVARFVEDPAAEPFECMMKLEPAVQLAAAQACHAQGCAVDAQFWASCACDAFKKTVGGTAALADALEALQTLAETATVSGSIEDAERAVRESRSLAEAAGSAAAAHRVAAIAAQIALAAARGLREDAESLATELEEATVSLRSPVVRMAKASTARARGDMSLGTNCGGSGALLAASAHYDTAVECLGEGDEELGPANDSNFASVAAWLSMGRSAFGERCRCEIARARLQVLMGDVDSSRVAVANVMTSLAAAPCPANAVVALDDGADDNAAALVGAPVPRVAPLETAQALYVLASMELRVECPCAEEVWASTLEGEGEQPMSKAAPKGRARATKAKGRVGKAKLDGVARARLLLGCAVRRCTQAPSVLRSVCAALAAAWRRPSASCALSEQERVAMAAAVHFAAVGAAPRQQHALALREKRARCIAGGNESVAALAGLEGALALDVACIAGANPTAAADSLDAALEGLPEDVPVCSISLCSGSSSAGAGSAGDDCGGARVLVCRLQRGRTPRFTSLAAGATARLAVDIDELISEAVEHARGAPASTASAAAKRKWWADRVGMDKRLSAMLTELTGEHMAKLPDVVFGVEARSNSDGGDGENAEAAPAVLVLDAPLAHLPWESTPAFADHRIYRTPCLSTVRSASVLATAATGSEAAAFVPSTAVAVADVGRAYYVLDPGGDLATTRATLEPWLSSLEGWRGVAGESPPQPEALAKELREAGLYAYFGHGGGEQYLGRRRLQAMPVGSGAVRAGAAPSLLMGCSSGALRPKGARSGIEASSGGALAYLLAGCPSAVANLWDVTDKDIDRFSTALLKDWLKADGADMAAAVPAARSACRLPHLIGAAPVCYGVPTALVRGAAIRSDH